MNEPSKKLTWLGIKMFLIYYISYTFVVLVWNYSWIDRFINSVFFIYDLFLLLFSSKLATFAYMFPNSHEIVISPAIPKIIVRADMPASFGP